MAIEFRCSQCNQMLRVPDESVGRSARCPKCQSLMQVPAASTASSGTAPTSIHPKPAPQPPAPGFPAPGFPSPASPYGSAPPLPQPSPPKASDPFSPFNPPAPPGNPFGEFGAGSKPAGSPFAGGAAPASANPYATPAFAGYSVPMQYGARTGLPWEVRGQGFRSWWDTMVMVLGSPSQAFTVMWQSGGLGNPIMFNFWGFGAPLGVIACLVIPIGVIIAIAGANNGAPAEGIGFGIGMILGIFLALVIYVFLVATVGALIWSAIIHVCLLMVGGTKQGFETTFRVISFSQGAIAPVGLLLGCVPYLGALIHLVWMITLTIIGISKAHEISGGKAALAVLLPAGVCFALGIGLVVLSVVMDANR